MLYEQALCTLENVGNEIALSFRYDFPAINQLTSVGLRSSVLPISSSVLNVGKTTDSTKSIVKIIQETYQNQHWRQPYQAADIGLEFVNNSAWFPVADINGPLVYSEGLMEVMVLGSKVVYPSHKHSPEELYVVLAGKVWWESEAETPSWKYAGEVIHHLPNVIHSIKAGNEPVLILNLWRGGSFEMLEGLPFELKDYLELVELTGRCLREDKAGHIEAN